MKRKKEAATVREVHPGDDVTFTRAATVVATPLKTVKPGGDAYGTFVHVTEGNRRMPVMSVSDDGARIVTALEDVLAKAPGPLSSKYLVRVARWAADHQDGEPLPVEVQAGALIGRRIVEARYLSEEERAEMGWTKSPIVLFLDDGTFLVPSQDDEGNDGGALLTEDGGYPVMYHDGAL